MKKMQTTNAQQCKTVQPPIQKEEWINTVLTEITINPKITNNQLAEKYGVHRNRISRYRNLIRKRQRTANFEIVNKIDGILEDQLLDMEPRDLINYRKQLTPQQVNVQADIREIRLAWQLESTQTANQIHTPPKSMDIPQ